MNKLKLSLFAALFFFLFAGQAQASGSNCAAVYGGGYSGSQSCAKISVDKKVLKPGTKDYVDGLSANDPKYSVNQDVTFQIVVQNVGNENLTDITVVDTLPQNLIYSSGAGSYDKNTNKLSFKITNLDVNTTQTFYVVARVNENFAFGDKGFVCVTNYVTATGQNGIASDDAAQLCVERQLKVYPPVLGIKQTPPTGPADAALPILLSMAGAGIYLTKKTYNMFSKGVTR